MLIYADHEEASFRSKTMTEFHPTVFDACAGVIDLVLSGNLIGPFPLCQNC